MTLFPLLIPILFLKVYSALDCPVHGRSRNSEALGEFRLGMVAGLVQLHEVTRLGS